MERFVFDELIKDLGSFYEKIKAPGKNSLDLWYQKTKNIPTESLEWIKNKIFDEHESFPKNISSALWAMYQEWLKAHPEKIHIKTYFKCPDCSDGLIICHKLVGERYYRYVFRCAKCRQDHTPAYPEAFKAHLMQTGFVFDYVPIPPRLRRKGNLGIAINSVVDTDKRSVLQEVPF